MLDQLAVERGLPLVCVQPLLVWRAREAEDLTWDKSDPKDAVVIARLAAERRCYEPERTDQTWARLRHLGVRRARLVTDATAGAQQLRDLLECVWSAVLAASGSPFRSASWRAALAVVLDRAGGDLTRPRRLGLARFTTAVRRELPRWGATRPCLRIVRAVFEALTDPAGVTAHRPGWPGAARHARPRPSTVWVPRMSSGLCDLRIRVLVDHATEPLTPTDNEVVGGRRPGSPGGRGLAEGAVRPVGVVVIDVDSEHVVELAAVHDQDPIEELSAKAADPPLRDRVRSGRADRGAHDLDAFGAEHGIEHGGELAVSVPDQVLEPAGPIAEIHDEVPGALGHPRPVRVGGDPEQPGPPGGELHDEEQVEAAEQHGVDVGEVAGQDAAGLGGQELPPALPDRRGAGSMPARRRISHTVEGVSRWPSPAGSPWILRYPQPGLSAAIRSRIVGRVAGRPPRRGTDQRRRIRSRCHRSTVSGVTNSRGQQLRGTSRLNAACTARSPKMDGVGRPAGAAPRAGGAG